MSTSAQPSSTSGAPSAASAVQDTTIALPHGIRLQCRTSGQKGRPVLVFLHGFPEGAFIWNDLLAHFARPENGGYRCVAPNLRGYAASSSPADVASYRASQLVQDIAALVAVESPGEPLAGLIAHDWGGAVAWTFANQHPQLLQRLAILNAPHPGPFWQALQHDEAQQAASQYMHFLCRPDADALLAANNFQRLFGFFKRPDGSLPDWLTPAVQTQFSEVWAQGLTGACNYYRASPLRPPLLSAAAKNESSSADGAETQRPALPAQLPDAVLQINVPTLLIWGMADPALRPVLLQGIEKWIPRLELQRWEGVSHWVLHEQPERVHQALSQWLAPIRTS